VGLIEFIVLAVVLGLIAYVIQTYVPLPPPIKLIIVVAIALQPTADYAGWKALWSHGFVRFAALLAVISLLLHAWIGVRDIFMDYVKPTGLRLALQVLVILALVLYGAWSVQILWSV